MTKIIYEYTLPDDDFDHKLAFYSYDYYKKLECLKSEMRSILKYNNHMFNGRMLKNTEEVQELAEYIQDFLFEDIIYPE